MKKLTILVDIDDVLNDLLDRWVENLNERYGLSANAQELAVWNVQSIYPTLTVEEVYAPMYEDDIWRKLSPRLTSVEYLKRMVDDGHDVVIVTASVYETLAIKMEWMYEHFPFLPRENIICARRKQLIKGDVLIDDGIHNLEGGEYFKILVDGPYNRSYDAEGNDMVRVHTIKEAYEAINKYLLEA